MDWLYSTLWTTVAVSGPYRNQKTHFDRMVFCGIGISIYAILQNHNLPQSCPAVLISAHSSIYWQRFYFRGSIQNPWRKYLDFGIRRWYCTTYKFMGGFTILNLLDENLEIIILIFQHSSHSTIHPKIWSTVMNLCMLDCQFGKYYGLLIHKTFVQGREPWLHSCYNYINYRILLTILSVDFNDNKLTNKTMVARS